MCEHWPIQLVLGIAICLLGMAVDCVADDADAAARSFISQHEAVIRPLDKASSLAWWNANVSGKDEDFKAKEEAQNKLDAALSSKERFAELKELRNQTIKDPLLRRQVEILYLQYLEKQVDKELLQKMVAKGNAIEQAFNVFRACVDGKEMADSEVRSILKTSTDSARRKAVWEASKVVGANVEKDLRELVVLRNQAAEKLGFKDYHAMMLYLNEQDQKQVEGLFDQLDELTREPYRKAKAEIDSLLAQRYGMKPSDLRPWHYHDPFFQESPGVFAADLDAPYKDVDVLKLCREYYAGIGLPIDDVLRRSDLYEKPGKSPHAFCTDIDREGDVRVLANIVPNHYWMGTMLHELGHAVYSSKNIPPSMPYAVRKEAHILTTEGVAMLFERAANSADWLEKMAVKVADPKTFNETGARMQRNRLLIFSRWCQVMFRFEKGMYANPNQDLNKLWWDLVERYQMVARPADRNAPDYASKIHVVTAPAYYHNYMMGELFASQVHHAIAEKVLHTSPEKALYVGQSKVGDYMKQYVLGPGATMSWNELTKFATGSELNPKAFAKDFEGSK
jgi:peptidyl-dipeptidase A